MIKITLLIFLTILLFKGSFATASSHPEENLRTLGIHLPKPAAPIGNYLPYKISGKLVYINQIPVMNGKLVHQGAIGINLSLDQAKEATRQTTLNILAVLKLALNGKLSKVKQVVQLTGFFQTQSGFKDHALVMNEASDLMVKVFEDAGFHARATVGAYSLPMNSPVEIQAIFEIE